MLGRCALSAEPPLYTPPLYTLRSHAVCIKGADRVTHGLPECTLQRLCTPRSLYADSNKVSLWNLHAHPQQQYTASAVAAHGKRGHVQVDP